MLLNSLMLCAAADGGDFEEVKRLIENGTSPNAKALWYEINCPMDLRMRLLYNSKVPALMT